MSVNSFSGQPAIPASYGFTAGKNKIINGDFGIWQRGTSITTGTYTSDRWVITGTSTASRQTFTPGTAPVAGYEGQYYLNWTITTNQQNNEMLQRIEDARTFAGQTVTLSFWARSTVGAQPLNVAIYQNFGTGGSPSSLTAATLLSGTSPYTPTSTWQRFVFTFSVPSVAGKTFGTNNDSFLWVRVAQMTTTATNTSFDIWGVQLEAGATATSFQTATGTLQGELAACQRYYQRFDKDANYSILTQLASAISTTQATLPLNLKTNMRVTPTTIDWSNISLSPDNYSTAYALTTLVVGSYATSSNVTLLGTVASGLTQFRPYFGHCTTSGYIGIGAEL